MVMKQADEVAGAPTIGGAKVAGAGTAASLLGGSAGEAVAKAAGKGPGPSPLGVRQLGYLTITADHLLLLNFKHGIWHPTANGILSRVPRELVTSIEVGRSLSMNPLVVRFTTGEEWHLQCDKANLGKVKALAAELAGDGAGARSDGA